MIKYKTSTLRSQKRLDSFNLVHTPYPSKSLDFKASNGIGGCLADDHQYHSEAMLTKDDFIAKRIEEGSEPQEALRLWEIVEKRRR